MKTPIDSELAGFVDSLNAHLRGFTNCHANEKEKYLLAALRNTSKLSYYIKAELDKLTSTNIKSKPILECELCGVKDLTHLALPLGHYLHIHICKKCWVSNETLKQNINHNLPTHLKLKLTNWPG